MLSLVFEKPDIEGKCHTEVQKMNHKSKAEILLLSIVSHSRAGLLNQRDLVNYILHRPNQFKWDYPNCDYVTTRVAHLNQCNLWSS